VHDYRRSAESPAPGFVQESQGKGGMSGRGVASGDAVSEAGAKHHSGVLLVGNFLSGSRPYRLACEDLAERLASRGWPVLTTSRKPGRLARVLDMVRTAWRERQRYRAAQVDLYSGSAFLWAEAACWTLRRVQRPYVLTLRGGDLPKFAGRRPRVVARLLRSAAAVTAPSRYLLEKMERYRADIELIPNGLDVTAYPTRPARPVGPSLVWLRAFHRIYNPELAVEVLARVRREFPNARLTMVGPDRGDGSLARTRRAAQRLGVEDRVEFPGGVSKRDVPHWLQKGDIFLNTTDVDNTPTSVLEAMASGLCVVSTNVGGLPYLLDSGKDALLVEPDDVDAMAGAVRTILNDAALASKLSRAAGEKARNTDWSVVLPRWEALLGSVARRDQEPTPC
jgi:glycosyltransferase involved in cell wall biosynthesis